MFGTPDTNKKTFFKTAKKVIHFRLYLVDVTLQFVILSYMQRHLGAEKDSEAQQCWAPATINMKNLDQTSFPNRAVKTFSVAKHLFRGIKLTFG